VADVPVSLPRARAEPARARAAERFLSRGRLAALVPVALFALTFDLAVVQDDGTVYFDFLARVLGDPTQARAVAYQFGSAFWTLPFYLASKLVALRGGFDGYHSAEVATTVAANAALLVCLYAGWRILRELDLPRGPAVLLTTLFGTPLFYYGVLQPSYKHAADALYATVGFWFVLRATLPGARRRDYAAAGVCLALMLATRYANVALCVPALAVLTAFRFRRAAAWIAGVGAVTCVLVFALPIVRHVPYDQPPNIYAAGDGPAWLAPAGVRSALGTSSIVDPVLRGSELDPAAPLKMLFTLHRGLFVWTPLTILATAGFVLLARRDRAHRPFLLSLGLGALGLLAIHAFWGRQWDGGGSFSQRFLTALFPFFLVGAAEFLRRARRPGVAAASLCACFSLFVGLVLFNGYYRQSAHDSITQVLGHFGGLTGPRTSRFHRPPPADSVENLGRDLGDRISGRWELYWRLVT